MVWGWCGSIGHGFIVLFLCVCTTFTIFSVLEVLEVLGIANYSMLVRVSSVFTFKNTVLGRARTVLGGARNWAFSFFFGVFRAKKTASLHGILFHGCKTVVMVTANRPVFAG